MRTYLAEMYPLPRRLLTSVLVSAGFATLVGRLHGLPLRWWSRPVLLGAASVFGLMLVLRLMDELKDQEVDRTLFPRRPLPSGRVLASDIRWSLAAASAAFLLLHAGTGAASWSAALVLAYALLMFRWFFVPDRMRPRLLLTLATHNPVVPLLLLHLLALFAASHRLPLARVRWAPSLVVVAIVWAATFAWEIARKVRSPEEEDAYVTYSRLLGPRGAVGLAAGAQAFALVAGLGLFRAERLSWAFPAALAVGWGVALVGHARFLALPGPRTSRLAPYAELNVLGVLVGGCLA